MTLAERFGDAQRRARQLDQRPSNHDLLDMYGLFKQASEGDVTGKRPPIFDVKGRAMYDAWSRHKGLSPAAAKEKYVALIDRLTG